MQPRPAGESSFRRIARALSHPARPGLRWSALLLAAVAGFGAAVAVAARLATEGSSPTPTTSPPAPVSPPTTAPTAPATTGAPPGPTVTTGTLPVAPGSPSTATATTAAPPPPRTPSRQILTWPHGRSGYTDILVSLPESAGREPAVGRARQARSAGLQDVGVLLSSRHSTLRAGYWVVFAGVYRSPAAAQAEVSTARARGFPGAYPARVAP
jgi:hypothetical protein